MVSETFIRKGNCEFFMFLSENNLGKAASLAGISKRHAAVLVKGWCAEGLLQREPVREAKYIYTALGLEVRMVFEDFEKVMLFE